ncbi:MAG: glycosyltransferase family 39 protein [candidate division WOR-3 bacterium]
MFNFRWLWLTLGLALCLRLIPWSFGIGHPERYLWGGEGTDTYQYHYIATNLVKHRAFSTWPMASYVICPNPHNCGAETSVSDPDPDRTPGYPLFLALFYWPTGCSTTAATLFQVILSTLTVALVFCIGKRLWGQKGGLLAALALACEPSSFLMASGVMAETLFAFILVLSLLLLFVWWDKPHPLFALLLGVSSASATLTKPTSLYLFPLLFLGLCLFYIVRRAWKRTLSAGLALIIYLGGIGLWYLRNYLEFRVPELTSIQGYTLMRFHYAAVRARIEGKDFLTMDSEIVREMGAILAEADSNPMLAARLMAERSTDYILQHPVDYFLVYLKGLPRGLMPAINTSYILTGRWIHSDLYIRLAGQGFSGFMDELSELWRREKATLLLWIPQAAILLGIYLLFVLGAWRGRRNPMVIFPMLYLAYLVLLPGPGSMARFRVAWAPFAVLVAGAAAIRRAH